MLGATVVADVTDVAAIADGDEVPLERLEAEICELAGHLAAGECRWLLLLSEFWPGSANSPSMLVSPAGSGCCARRRPGASGITLIPSGDGDDTSTHRRRAGRPSGARRGRGHLDAGGGPASGP